ncbi:MAG: hypothetical protein HZA79_14970 [Sphingobacteriales bacterium]|nr:hypothetical protein [Sphingobacteriales bacterium]
MKWLPFFLGIVLLSCHTKMKRAEEPVQVKAYTDTIVYNYNDTVDMPWSSGPEVDTGYFKGHIPEKLTRIELEDTTRLFRFLTGLISKKELSLQNAQTLSNSVLVDQVQKVRKDTLRNDKTEIISIYYFGERVHQRISINGFLIRGYNGDGQDIMGEDQIEFDSQSFRHFVFKSKEYYYIRAGSIYSGGASMGNVNYHLIYDLKHRRLNCFQTCRFGYGLFGDADGDDRLDYLEFDNSDFCTTVPYSDFATIRLYSINPMGNFELQKDRKGKTYFIEGRTGEGWMQDSFNVVSHYWPQPLPVQ